QFAQFMPALRLLRSFWSCRLRLAAPSVELHAHLPAPDAQADNDPRKLQALLVLLVGDIIELDPEHFAGGGEPADSGAAGGFHRIAVRPWVPVHRQRARAAEVSEGHRGL